MFNIVRQFLALFIIVLVYPFMGVGYLCHYIVDDIGELAMWVKGKE